MYRPPNSNKDYWKKMEDALDTAKNSNIANLFILGDLNCNYLINNNKLQRILENRHLYQLINEPTHIKDNSQSCIDMIITNCINFVSKSGTLKPSLSDHSPVYACLKVKKEKQTTYKRGMWILKDIDWENLNIHLKNLNWNPAFEQTNVSDMITKWTDIYLEAIKIYIPFKHVTIRSEDPKWMTNDIRKLMRKRNRQHSRAKKQNTQESWDKYKKLRNEVIQTVRKAKHDATTKDEEYINNSQGKDPKIWWRLVKQFYKANNSTQSLNHPLIVNDNILTTSKDRANALNNFFAEQTVLENNNTILPPLDPLLSGSLNTININTCMVKEMLQILKTSKSTGPDGINPKILKNTSESIAPSLSKIFNYSLKSGVFPDSWKIAQVTPLFKKGESHLVKNYRPISLLNILSKIFEKLVFKEMYNYLTRNKRLSYLQAAYTPGSSTEHQLLEIYDTILNTMEEGKIIRFAFLDCSKAFDRVWHRGLLYKLESLGIGGTLLKWIKSYLTDRSQYVVINGIKSDTKKLYAGVPQGSILGPLLFLIYVNDMIDSVTCNIRLYADDCSIFVTGTDPVKIASDLSKSLTEITEWAKKWQVTFNPNSTKLFTAIDLLWQL